MAEQVGPDGEEGLGQRRRADRVIALGPGQALRRRRGAVFGIGAAIGQGADLVAGASSPASGPTPPPRPRSPARSAGWRPAAAGIRPCAAPRPAGSPRWPGRGSAPRPAWAAAAARCFGTRTSGGAARAMVDIGHGLGQPGIPAYPSRRAREVPRGSRPSSWPRAWPLAQARRGALTPGAGYAPAAHARPGRSHAHDRPPPAAGRPRRHGGHGRPAAAQPAGETTRIGALFPFTGPLALLGESISAAWNWRPRSATPPVGCCKPIRLVRGDAADAGQAQAEVKRLIGPERALARSSAPVPRRSPSPPPRRPELQGVPYIEWARWPTRSPIAASASCSAPARAMEIGRVGVDAIADLLARPGPARPRR